jgi:hypothetical protein
MGFAARLRGGGQSPSEWFERPCPVPVEEAAGAPCGTETAGGANGAARAGDVRRTGARSRRRRRERRHGCRLWRRRQRMEGVTVQGSGRGASRRHACGGRPTGPLTGSLGALIVILGKLAVTPTPREARLDRLVRPGPKPPCASSALLPGRSRRVGSAPPPRRAPTWPLADETWAFANACAQPHAIARYAGRVRQTTEPSRA